MKFSLIKGTSMISFIIEASTISMRSDLQKLEQQEYHN